MQSNDMITNENCKNAILCICEKIGWDFNTICSKSRNANHVRMRIVLIGILYPRFRLPTLGAVMNRDHSTIQHSLDHTRYDMIDSSGRVYDPELYELYQYVEKVYQGCKEKTF
jgi:chromosomal replication initiation ATPase DnaA